MFRLFVAVELADDIKNNLSHLINVINDPSLRQLRWVTIQNIHLTLKFIGEIQEDKVSLVSQKIAEIACKFDIFDIQIGGLGAFPQIEKPRVVWVGCEMPPSGYTLQKEIESSLIPLGVVKEKKFFHPHLTLARASRSTRKEDYIKIAAAIRKIGLTKTWRMRIDQVKLFRSVLMPSGARYSVISTALLNKST